MAYNIRMPKVAPQSKKLIKPVANAGKQEVTGVVAHQMSEMDYLIQLGENYIFAALTPAELKFLANRALRVTANKEIKEERQKRLKA